MPASAKVGNSSGINVYLLISFLAGFGFGMLLLYKVGLF